MLNGRLEHRLGAKFLLAALFCSALSATVQAAEPSEEPQRCLRLTEISSVTVLNNKQILFEASHKRYYLNTLPHGCPGLRRNSPIMYRTSLDQLCSVDVITVLDSAWGGFMPGASCGLGKFVPVDEEEAKALRSRHGKEHG